MSKQSEPATKQDISELKEDVSGLNSKFEEVIDKLDGLVGTIEEIRDNQIVANQPHRDLEDRVYGLDKIHPQGRHLAT